MSIILVAYTLVAWLAHSAMVGLYSKLFESTTSIAFRATHMLEIFITVVIMITLYKATVDSPVSATAAVLTVLVTLFILDGTVLALFETLRQKFDIGHFILAYLATILAVVLALKK